MPKRLPRPAKVGEAVRGLILKLILCKKKNSTVPRKKIVSRGPTFPFLVLSETKFQVWAKRR